MNETTNDVIIENLDMYETASAAARRVVVTTATIHAWVRAGLLPAKGVQFGNRQMVLLVQSDVDRIAAMTPGARRQLLADAAQD